MAYAITHRRLALVQFEPWWGLRGWAPGDYRVAMALSMDDFIAELRRMVPHWKKDFARVKTRSGNPLAGQIEAWLDEAERIIAAHDGRDA